MMKGNGEGKGKGGVRGGSAAGRDGLNRVGLLRDEYKTPT